MQYLSFCDWLISLSIISSACVTVSSLLKTKKYSTVSTFCLAIYPLMDILVTSIFWLVWIMLLQTLVYKYLFETEPKSLCPILQKAKTQHVWVWSKEKFIEKTPTKMGDLLVLQIHLARWTRPRVFKGLGGTGMRKGWWDKF